MLDTVSYTIHSFLLTQQLGEQEYNECKKVAARGELRFGLVGDVPPAAQDPYPCSGGNLSKNSYRYPFFSEKRYPFLAILPQKHTKFSA